MGEKAMCAHIRISYRTEIDEEGHTSGWWECDSDCGTIFLPETMVVKLAGALARIKVCATVPLTVWSVARAKRCLIDIHRMVDEALGGE